MAAGGVNDPRVAGAFALVPREDFRSPGPWPFLRWFRVDASTPSDTDDLVGILPNRDLNNHQLSLNAMMIANIAPQEGEHFVHIAARDRLLYGDPGRARRTLGCGGPYRV